jgi:signal transduction histidine kinase
MPTSTEEVAFAPIDAGKPGSSKLHVLLIEDSQLDIELVLKELRRGGFEPTSSVVQTPEAFRDEVRVCNPDVILADYNLPGWRGMEALEILRQEQLDIPVILVSGFIGEETAVEYIKQGATDYVLKGRLARLPNAIRRAMQERKLREQKKYAEEELAKKMLELARSNQELEQFASVASHDLREPLRMVATYTQLLAERYQGKLDETADKYIGYATDGALRMQTLIQDLLSLSRVGVEGPERTVVDCNLLLDEVLRDMTRVIEETGTVVERSPLPEVVAGRSQVAELFQNLIENAIKFRGDRKPTVVVKADLVKQDLVFQVSDNGIGIAAESRENIFAVFHRLHARTEYAGNGIGLAICKKIVSQHGGSIWVESEPGQGSTFKFTLPGGGRQDPA